MTPVVRFESVEKRFRIGERDVMALDGVDLEIHPGEFLSVVGPSGSGKSTFLRIAGTLEKPSAGSVLFDGTDLSELDDDERSRLRLVDIGFVFQQFSLLPRMSALDNVALPLVYRGVPRRDRYARASEILEVVGLSDRKQHTPAQLSGGQQQRVAIARALVNSPRLLLADEPTGALDSHTGSELLALLADLNRAGTAVVVVSHDPEIGNLGTRRLSFHDGRLVSGDSRVRASTTEIAPS